MNIKANQKNSNETKSVQNNTNLDETAKKPSFSVTQCSFTSELTIPAQNYKKQQEQKFTLINQKLFVIILSLFTGLEAICGLSTFYYQKDILKLSPEFIQFYEGLIFMPWSIKPIFGFMFDQSMKKIQKTKYIVYGCSIIKFIGYLIITYIPLNWVCFYSIRFFMVLAGLFINILCEYLLVLSTKKANEQNENGESENHLPIYFGYRCVGSLIGGFLGGRIIDQYGVMYNFYICLFIPLIVIFIAILYREQQHDINHNPRTIMEELNAIKSLIFRERVFPMVIFVFLLNMTPSFDTLTTFYMTNKLKFSSIDLANFSTIGTIFYILGLVYYSKYLISVSASKLFLITNFVLWLINISFLLVIFDQVEQMGISNKVFCYFTQGIQNLIAELNFMPILTIWCAICPKNLEATSITLFTGLSNLSFSFSSYFGSLLQILLNVSDTNLDKIWLPLLIQNGYMLVMTIAILFIDFPQVNIKEQEKISEKNENNIVQPLKIEDTCIKQLD